MKQIIKSIVIMVFAAIFIGCGKDAPVEIAEKKVTKLQLSESAVKILVQGEASVDIKQGGDDYNVFSLNNEIATVEKTNNQLKIKGVGIGVTNIVVSDKESQYSQVKVAVYRSEITVEKESVEIGMRLGATGRTQQIKILTGNNGYTVSSDKPDIASATIEDSTIIVTAIKEGEVKLTLKDMLDFEKEISVKVSTTTEPYTKEELEEIKASTEILYAYKEETPVKPGQSGRTFYNTVEDGMNLYGWNYYNYFYMKFMFPGDKSVGKKEGALFTHKSWDNEFDKEPCKFEILKNDGTLIWAVYSFVKDEKLNYGYFIQKINP